MKFINAIIATFLFISAISAQQIPHQDITIGKFSNTDSLLKGIEYTFPDKIYRLYYDSINQNMIVELRGIKNDKWWNNKGDLFVVNTNNRQTLWFEKMNYIGQNIIQSGDIILKFNNLTIKNNGKFQLLNPNNGTPIWANSASIFQLNKKNNIALGYGTNKPNRLYGVDLTTGDDKWTRELAHDYGWNGSFLLNDSTLLVLAYGLHTINLKTGKGWDFDMMTGTKDYSGTVAANIAGVALGLLTGAFMFTDAHSTVTDIASNAIIKEEKIYFASKQKLACLDFEGKPVWLTPIPKDSTSKSAIFIKNKTIYMVNYGFAFLNGRQIAYGKSFIAAFDVETGKKMYSESFKKEDIIADFKLNNADNSIVLLTKNKLLKCDLITGKLINELLVKNTKDDPLTSFVGQHVFEKTTNDTYQSIVLSDTSHTIVATEKNTIITFDAQFNGLKEQSFDQLYVNRKQLSNLTFLTNPKEVIILDQNNTAKAVINGEYLTYFTPSKVFLTNKNKIIELNLNDFN